MLRCYTFNAYVNIMQTDDESLLYKEQLRNVVHARTLMLLLLLIKLVLSKKPNRKRVSSMLSREYIDNR